MKNTSTTGEQRTERRPTLESRLRRDRKYKAFWVVFLFSCTALFWDKLNGDQWVDTVIFVFGLYMAGNVGEHYTRKK